MKNWKTSLFGGLAAACGAVSQAPGVPDEYRMYAVIGAAASGALFAFFSKDHDVTGAGK